MKPRYSIYSKEPLINDATYFDDIKFIVEYADTFSMKDIETISLGFASATHTYRDDFAEYKTAYDQKPHYYVYQYGNKLIIEKK